MFGRRRKRILPLDLSCGVMVMIDVARQTQAGRGEPGMTSADAARVRERELGGVQREVALFPDDTLLWRTAPATPNAPANLALHVAGGIQHFIGAALGGTGYVRDRAAEFSRRSGTRADLHAELDR